MSLLLLINFTGAVKELKEEIQRLLKLQQEGLFSNTKDSDIPMLNASVDNQNGSEITPMRPNNAATTLTISHSVVGTGSIPASIGQSRKKSMSSEPSTDLRLVYTRPRYLCSQIQNLLYFSFYLDHFIISLNAAGKSTPVWVIFSFQIREYIGMSLVSTR